MFLAYVTVTLTAAEDRERDGTYDGPAHVCWKVVT
jgi:hypothetical protein